MVIILLISHIREGTFLFRLLLLARYDSHKIIGAAGLILVLVFELLFHLLDFCVSTILLHSHQVHLLYVLHLMLLGDEKALVRV